MTPPNRTVVALPAHGPAVVPVAALPAVRAAVRVHADDSVPDAVVAELGATRLTDGRYADDPDGPEVLFTTDPGHRGEPPERVIGTPGAALLDSVAVMDRLRSPGGCPWDAEQTHESLLPYLVEECYELYQAIEDGDRAAIREELGDVLLQVLFHARVAQPGFTVDDVAADLVAKLVGRHPHVFAGSETVDTAERQEHRWEELKRAEKQRESSVDGVATAQPAVALAAKLTSRTARAGLPDELLPTGSGVGEALFALAARAKLAGVDPEAQLRTAALRFAADVRAAESAARDAGLDPHALDGPAWLRFWPR
ncbi:MazG family protein [Pseudonocardia sp.]|uniref:MazG family protein n=1 Tax=Pseudonocardia sp. TaxID=60912 RepID=UPI002604806F|nr:MazG family protein [Pseudonocardia sp.]